MAEFDFLHSGEIYTCDNEALAEEQLLWLDKLYDFNMTRPTEQAKRT